MRVWLVFLFIVVAGCMPGADPGIDALSGTQGVEVSILQAPSEVYENEEFPVVIEFANRGTANVSEDNPGRFFVSVDSLYLSRSEHYVAPSRFSQLDRGFFLRGREQYVLGEEVLITQYFTALPIRRQSQRVSTPITVTACYPYKTTLTTQVCIERSRVEDPGSVVCLNRPVRPPSPGAPVAVREVEVRTTASPVGDGGAVTTFRITIENVGRGTPGARGCDPSEINQDVNHVVLSAFLLNEPLSCGFSISEEGTSDSFSTLVPLRQGLGTVSCRLPEGVFLPGASNNMISLLSVEMDYSYRISDRHEVTIVR